MDRIEEQMKDLNRKHQLIIRFSKFMVTLNEDLRETSSLVKERGSNSQMRNLFRCVFSTIEGIVFSFKQIAFAANPDVFNMGEREFLIEVDYQIDGKGDVKEKSLNINTRDNIKFALKAYCRAFELDKTVEYGSSGWQNLEDSIKIRHRLTHPKDLESLDLNESDIRKFEAGIDYLYNHMSDLIDATGESLHRRYQELKLIKDLVEPL